MRASGWSPCAAICRSIAARLRRLNSAGGKVKVTDLVAHSDQLAMLMAIESGKDLEGTPLEPYDSLARGNLAAAVLQAKKIKDGSERVLRLVASSDGATREMIDEALALPLGEPDDFEIRSPCTPSPSGISAIRRPIWPTSRRFGPARQAGTGVPGKRATRRESCTGARRTAAVRFSLRLHAMHAAVIMLDQRAPADWRKESSRGLFVGERGYMRSL